MPIRFDLPAGDERLHLAPARNLRFFSPSRYAEHMLSKLPGWVVDDAQSVREEVADWINTTPAERWQLAKLCARDAAWAAAASGRREQVLAYEEPLPASTLAALERLRRQAHWGDADR